MKNRSLRDGPGHGHATAPAVVIVVHSTARMSIAVVVGVIRIAVAVASVVLATGGCGGSEDKGSPSPGGCSDSTSIVRTLAARLPLVAPDLGPFRMEPLTARPERIPLSWRRPPDPKSWPPTDIDTRSPAMMWAPDSSAFVFLECCAGDVDAYVFVYFLADTVTALQYATLGPSSDVLDISWCDSHSLLMVSRDTYDDGIFVSVLDLRPRPADGDLHFMTGDAKIRYEGTVPPESALYESIWAYHLKIGRAER